MSGPNPAQAEFYTEVGKGMWAEAYIARHNRQPSQEELNAAADLFFATASGWCMENALLLGQLAEVAATVQELRAQGSWSDARAHLESSVFDANTFSPLFDAYGGAAARAFVQSGLYGGEERMTTVLEALTAFRLS